MTTFTPPARPALRFHGGKWRMAPWIIEHLPAHDVYVEPYAGSLSVLLRKPPALLDVANDLNLDVWTFFRVLRTREEELLRAIRLTPYHEHEVEVAETTEPPADDPLERARLVYVRAFQTMGGVRSRRTRSGTRFDVHPTSTTNVAQWGKLDHLHAVAERLKRVQFHQRDALWLIRRYQGIDVAFYVDPPYVESTRGDRWKNAAYAVESDDATHVALAAALHEVRAAGIVLSGYPSPLYDRLYCGWERVERTVRTQGRTEATECLWIAPPLEERLKLWREKRAEAERGRQLEIPLDRLVAAG